MLTPPPAPWRADFKEMSHAAAINPPPDLHIIRGCSIGPERLRREKRHFDSNSAFQSGRAASEADQLIEGGRRKLRSSRSSTRVSLFCCSTKLRMFCPHVSGSPGSDPTFRTA